MYGIHGLPRASSATHVENTLRFDIKYNAQLRSILTIHRARLHCSEHELVIIQPGITGIRNNVVRAINYIAPFSIYGASAAIARCTAKEDGRRESRRWLYLKSKERNNNDTAPVLSIDSTLAQRADTKGERRRCPRFSLVPHLIRNFAIVILTLCRLHSVDPISTRDRGLLSLMSQSYSNNNHLFARSWLSLSYVID